MTLLRTNKLSSQAILKLFMVSSSELACGEGRGIKPTRRRISRGARSLEQSSLNETFCWFRLCIRRHGAVVKTWSRGWPAGRCVASPNSKRLIVELLNGELFFLQLQTGVANFLRASSPELSLGLEYVVYLCSLVRTR